MATLKHEIEELELDRKSCEVRRLSLLNARHERLGCGIRDLEQEEVDDQSKVQDVDIQSALLAAKEARLNNQESSNTIRE